MITREAVLKTMPDWGGIVAQLLLAASCFGFLLFFMYVLPSGIQVLFAILGAGNLGTALARIGFRWQLSHLLRSE